MAICVFQIQQQIEKQQQDVILLIKQGTDVKGGHARSCVGTASGTTGVRISHIWSFLS